MLTKRGRGTRSPGQHFYLEPRFKGGNKRFPGANWGMGSQVSVLQQGHAELGTFRVFLRLAFGQLTLLVVNISPCK